MFETLPRPETSTVFGQPLYPSANSSFDGMNHYGLELPPPITPSIEAVYLSYVINLPAQRPASVLPALLCALTLVAFLPQQPPSLSLLFNSLQTRLRTSFVAFSKSSPWLLPSLLRILRYAIPVLFPKQSGMYHVKLSACSHCCLFHRKDDRMTIVFIPLT